MQLHSSQYTLNAPKIGRAGAMGRNLQDRAGTTRDPEQVIRRLYAEIWNAGRYDLADDLFDPDFHHDDATGLQGPAAKMAAIRGYRTTFPDLHVTVNDVVVQGDKAAVRWRVTGTDTGGFRGRAPTGQPVSGWGTEFFGFRGGRIITNWLGADWLGVLIQLGVVPNPWTS